MGHGRHLARGDKKPPPIEAKRALLPVGARACQCKCHASEREFVRTVGNRRITQQQSTGQRTRTCAGNPKLSPPNRAAGAPYVSTPATGAGAGAGAAGPLKLPRGAAPAAGAVLAAAAAAAAALNDGGGASRSPINDPKGDSSTAAAPCVAAAGAGVDSGAIGGLLAGTPLDEPKPDDDVAVFGAGAWTSVRGAAAGGAGNDDGVGAGVCCTAVGSGAGVGTGTGAGAGV